MSIEKIEVFLFRAGGFKWMYKEDYDKLTQQNDLSEIEPIENLTEDKDDEI